MSIENIKLELAAMSQTPNTEDDHTTIGNFNDRIPQNTQVPTLQEHLRVNHPNASSQLDPKKLFELVSKNYETWLHAMSKQFQDEDNFLPIPNDENDFAGSSDDSQPIFNYSLLEALEKASSEFSDKISKLDGEDLMDEISATIDPETDKNASKKKTKSNEVKDVLLRDSEIDFLRTKISQMINSNDFTLHNKNKGHYYPPRPPPPPRKREGFSLYDTQDEEGLHEGNTDAYYDHDDLDDYDDGQDDYDIDEVNDDQYLYDSPTHHIEVELNTAPECDEHGMNGCDCPIYENDTNARLRDRFDEEGPSCEFTFEYDHTGKLVPIYSNVEEKLRLMTLQSRMAGAGTNFSLTGAPTLGDADANMSKKKKNKKKKKKKKSQNPQISTFTNSTNMLLSSGGCCLFCEYEAVFGSKPKQMMKWYNQRIQQDEQRREEIKKKLEIAKLKAIKKQRELRQKQYEQQNGHHLDISSPPPPHESVEPLKVEELSNSG
jgi:hypothetical protein